MKEFYDDVRDKKALVPSSRHRVCGAKSKKCTLPSDNLTAAQKRKLNGPCETYAINKPCDWETFKAMPNDIAQAWLDYVQNRFEVSPECIAKALWSDQVSHFSIKNYINKHGLNFKKYGRSSNKDIAEIQRWAAGAVEVEPAPIVEEPVLVVEEPVPVVEEIAPIEETPQEPVEEPQQKPSVKAQVVSEHIAMEIAGDWEAIRAALDQRFAGKKVSLTVQADICHTQGGDAGG